MNKKTKSRLYNKIIEIGVRLCQSKGIAIRYSSSTPSIIVFQKFEKRMTLPQELRLIEFGGADEKIIEAIGFINDMATVIYNGYSLYDYQVELLEEIHQKTTDNKWWK